MHEGDIRQRGKGTEARHLWSGIDLNAGKCCHSE